MLPFSQVLPPKIHEEMPELAKRRDSRSTRRCKHSWRTQRVHERLQAYLGKTKKIKYVLFLAPVLECHVRERESLTFWLQSSFFSAFLVKQFVRMNSFPTIQSLPKAASHMIQTSYRSFHWWKGNRWMVVDGGYWLLSGYVSNLQSTSTIHLVFTSTLSGLHKSWKLHLYI